MNYANREACIVHECVLRQQTIIVVVSWYLPRTSVAPQSRTSLLLVRSRSSGVKRITCEAGNKEEGDKKLI
eukprot:959418-Rhodomonas_salina.5